MSMRENELGPVDGPPAWLNWHAANEGAPALGALETSIYSDAWTTGEVTSGLGPYQFFNTVASQYGRGVIRTAVVLRINLHTEFDTPPMTKTDTNYYYGGSFADELAALASLFTGARLRAGGETRHFDPAGDPRGRPIARQVGPEPTLPMSLNGIVLPRTGGELSLMPLEALQKYPRLKAADAIALIRAARLYQDALWVAESEPHLAWIMLVSAVEAAAGRSNISGSDSLSRLTASKPEFVAYLDQLGITGLTQRIADEFVDTLGATRKFVEFLSTHLPSPPSSRPDAWRQLSWETNELRRAFRVLYGHRSRALHDGIPFPAPLCSPVLYAGRTEVPSERPAFPAASQQGGTWLDKDMPMYLHTFEYIARCAIIQWYEGLAT